MSWRSRVLWSGTTDVLKAFVRFLGALVLVALIVGMGCLRTKLACGA